MAGRAVPVTGPPCVPPPRMELSVERHLRHAAGRSAVPRGADTDRATRIRRAVPSAGASGHPLHWSPPRPGVLDASPTLTMFAASGPSFARRGRLARLDDLHPHLEIRLSPSEQGAAGRRRIRVVPPERDPHVPVIGNAVVGGIDSEPADIRQQELRPRVAGPFRRLLSRRPFQVKGSRTRIGWECPRCDRAQSSHGYSPGRRRAASRGCVPWASPPRCFPARSGTRHAGHAQSPAAFPGDRSRARCRRRRRRRRAQAPGLRSGSRRGTPSTARGPPGGRERTRRPPPCAGEGEARRRSPRGSASAPMSRDARGAR